jgi:hypothetical protein
LKFYIMRLKVAVSNTPFHVAGPSSYPTETTVSIINYDQSPNVSFLYLPLSAKQRDDFSANASEHFSG